MAFAQDVCVTLLLVGNLLLSFLLLSVLTGFINLLHSGTCHQDIIPILFGWRPVALDKLSSNIRPIAVGFTLHRLALKGAKSLATSQLASYFSPHQLGAGIKGGCEALVHATCRFLHSLLHNSVIAKLVFLNASITLIVI